MTGTRSRLKTFRVEIGLFLVLMAGGLALAAWTANNQPVLSTESVVRVGVARDLLHGFPRGRQGLVGSLEWAPLPTLLLMPLVRLPAPFGGDWAPVVVSLAAAAFLAAFLSAWLRRCGMGRFLRLAVCLAFFLSPVVQRTIFSGSAEPIFWLMLFAAVCFLAHWWETEELRSLAYLSLALALAVATRYQAVILFIVAGLFVALHLRGRYGRRSYAEATLIIFLVPGLYVLLLWLATNWLIMGDVSFFFRGMFVDSGLWTCAGHIMDNAREWGHLALLIVLSLAVWWLRGIGVYCRGIVSGVIVLLICIPIWWHVPSDRVRGPETERQVELAMVARDLAADYSDDWILYSGYLGYEFSKPHGEQKINHIQHTLSFYLDSVLADTKGKQTYILVPQPAASGCWEDMNLKYPEMFSQGTYFTVFERGWEHWRLFRVVRMDETDRLVDDDTVLSSSDIGISGFKPKQPEPSEPSQPPTGSGGEPEEPSGRGRGSRLPDTAPLRPTPSRPVPSRAPGR